MKFILVVAALVFFVLAAIAGFGELDWRWQGLVAVGFSLWCASTVAPEKMPG